MSNSYKFPPLKWLMSFEAAARHMSFTAAAEELGLSQAAVSYQIKCLESMIKAPLFERKPRNLRLTAVGQAYLPPIRRAFDEMFASTAGLFGNHGEKVVTVRVAISFMTRCLAPAMKDFYRQHPEIRVNFWSSIWANSDEADEADIDIRFGAGDWTGYDTTLLANDTAVLVSSPENASMVQRSEDLANIPERMMINVAGYDDLWRRALVQTDIRPALGKGIRVDTTIAASELVAAGAGFAFLSKLFSHSDLESGRLVMPGDIELKMERAHYLLQPKSQKRPGTEVLIFKEWLLAQRW
ncbi:LysR family transcriptional regulator [Roseovarius pelagicus]|uniref:LysR substrate-binding domain-containing protein n=1 Tax=Roseovarius pelagicus TaxID=2980108 RepID=A0ABY6D746_9RHOB|nr:LysR family transcriptional regulator [Roseovarius pelagicus]UXX81729.1 LysR substrate-binding domain-containing protein [Roseovarius pelagicus]